MEVAHKTTKLQVLLSTINDRFSSVEQVIRLRHPDLSYLIVHQHVEHSDEADVIALKSRLQERPDVRLIESESRGLSISRNICIKNATAEIVLIADDDIQYKPDLVETVLGVFNQDNCDVATFTIQPRSPTRRYRWHEQHRHNNVSILGVSSVEIAFRLASIKRNEIWFDRQFGLGSTYPTSEEAIFLRDCIDSDLKVMFVPEAIAKHDHKSSGEDWSNKQTWFSKGAVFRRMYGYPGILFIVIFALTKWRYYKPFFGLFEFMKKNIENFSEYKALSIK